LQLTETPQKLYFTNLWFGNDGYLILFSAKDPTMGLDVNPSNYTFQNLNAVNDLDYYRNYMGKAKPVTPLVPAISAMLLC
jgi:hypothetical protein